ncbi:MAG: FkbM family methyltransferase [Polyangiaceae bacterium]
MPYFVKLPDPIEAGDEPVERYVNIINGMSTIGQRQLRRTGYGGYEVDTAATLCSIFQMMRRGELARPPLAEPSAGPVTFFDVGSNCGHFTMLCKGLWPDACVVSFEPTPDTYSQLSQVIRANLMDVRTENVAVGAEEGEVTLYLSSKSDSSNSLNPSFREHKGTVQVRCITLDGYCERSEIAPHVVKIDTETFEEAVLRGSVELLKRQHPFIVVEVLQKAGADTAERITKLIRDVGGYILYRITDADVLERHDAITGSSDGDHLNWLLSPVELGDDFFGTMAAWRKSIRECTKSTNVAPRVGRAVPAEGGRILEAAKRARLAGDTATAVARYEEAAGLGATTAHYWLGRMAEDTAAYEVSLRHYNTGAAADEPAAIRGLARAYALGRGVDKDVTKAQELLEKGVAFGDKRSALELAKLVKEQSSPEDAMRWYERAAAIGATQAYYHLARYHEDKKQYDRSLAYYLEGAERGEAACMRGVARAYELGRGAKVDKDLAAGWSKRAEEATAK